jgi:hypothetical protein
MDDHTADAPVADEEAAGAAITKAWNNPASDKRKAMDDALEAKLGTPEAVLEMYRAYNAPGLGSSPSTATSAPRWKSLRRRSSVAATSATGRHATCAWRPTSATCWERSRAAARS